MKKKTWIIGALTALAVTAFGGIALAKGHGGPPGFFLERMIDALDLDDKQEDMVLEIKNDLWKQRRAMRKEHKAALKDAMGELTKAKPDRAKLHSLADKHIEAMKVTVHQVIDRLLEVQATLTPEQREKLGKRLERFNDRAERWE